MFSLSLHHFVHCFQLKFTPLYILFWAQVFTIVYTFLSAGLHQCVHYLEHKLTPLCTLSSDQGYTILYTVFSSSLQHGIHYHELKFITLCTLSSVQVYTNVFAIFSSSLHTIFSSIFIICVWAGLQWWWSSLSLLSFKYLILTTFSQKSYLHH